MKFTSENLKKLCNLNIALILVVIILRAISIPKVSTYAKIDSVICIVALISGLLYSLNGYKKDAAKYYKFFLALYAISSILSLVSPMVVKFNIFVICVNAIVTICVCALAFVKDLGEKKSKLFAEVCLAVNVITMIYGLITSVSSNVIAAGCSNLLLSWITFVFVLAKYADKESRGAK